MAVLLCVCAYAVTACSAATSPGERPPAPVGKSSIADSGGTKASVGSLRGAVKLALEQRDTTMYLTARGRLTNGGTQTIHLEYGACSLQILAYRDSSRTGQPVWNSDYRKIWNQGVFWACPMYLAMKDLAPGATLDAGEFGLSVPLIEVLGDSLPDGRYWFTAQIRTNLNVATYMSAGAADLALYRPLLPASRISESLTFVSEPVTVAGSPRVVTARGAIRLHYAGGALISYPKDCALRQHTYADRVRRDAAPRSGAADWTQQVACSGAMETISMSRGDVKSFQTTVSQAEILGSSRAAGKYYFAIEIVAQRNDVFLTAGEADLTR